MNMTVKVGHSSGKRGQWPNHRDIAAISGCTVMVRARGAVYNACCVRRCLARSTGAVVAYFLSISRLLKNNLLTAQGWAAIFQTRFMCLKNEVKQKSHFLLYGLKKPMDGLFQQPVRRENHCSLIGCAWERGCLRPAPEI